MTYRSEKAGRIADTKQGWGRTALACGAALIAMTIAPPLGASPSAPPSGVSSKAAEKGAAATSGAVLVGDQSDASRPRTRQRGGSAAQGRHIEPTSPRAKTGEAGEVEGGTSGPRPGPHETKPPVANGGASSKPPCVRDAVQFERGFGGDSASIALTRCDGQPIGAAIEQLSILVRPMNVARPSALASRIRRAAHREWLPGVKRIHDGLVTRLQNVVDHFQAKKITLVSGYRPTSLGSFHQSARALDLHVEGVANEKLVEFCRALVDTGCGYYPNSSFVHIDVRPAGTGHVYWIDASGPGEPARYVSSWPPKDSASLTSGIAPPDSAAPLDEQTHAGAARPPIGGSDAKIDARTTAPWWGGESRESAFSP